MKLVKHHRTLGDWHEFEVPAGENEELTLCMRVTNEGIIIDVSDDSGEVVKTAYQLWADLEEMAH